MSEEEAIKILNTYKGNLSQQKKNPKITKAIDRIIDALEEKNIFLDLYNKEKEKNKELEKYKILLAESTANRVMTSLKDSQKSKEDLEMLNEGWKIELEQKDKLIDKMKKRVVLTEKEHRMILKMLERFPNRSYEDCTLEYFKKESEEK